MTKVAPRLWNADCPIHPRTDTSSRYKALLVKSYAIVSQDSTSAKVNEEWQTNLCILRTLTHVRCSIRLPQSFLRQRSFCNESTRDITKQAIEWSWRVLIKRVERQGARRHIMSPFHHAKENKAERASPVIQGLNLLQKWSFPIRSISWSPEPP